MKTMPISTFDKYLIIGTVVLVLFFGGFGLVVYGSYIVVTTQKLPVIVWVGAVLMVVAWIIALQLLKMKSEVDAEIAKRKEEKAKEENQAA
jgi:hypothetical protein